MRARFLAMAAALATAAAAAPAVADSAREESSAFVAGSGATVDCAALIGGACFDVRPRERQAAVTVLDDSGTAVPVSTAWRVVDAAGAALAVGELCGSTALALPAGAVRIELMPRVVGLPDCATADGPSRASQGKAFVRFSEAASPLAPIDVEPESCLQPLPDRLALELADRVQLDVLVLVDGITRERAETLLHQVAAYYEPLRIDVRPRLRVVDLEATTAQALLSASRNAVGGERPAGTDVVVTVTSKALNALGMADCIGGVRYPLRAFGFITDVPDRPLRYVGSYVEGPVIEHLAAKALAHEIGHLLGGQHHLGEYVSQPGFATLMTSPPLVGYGTTWSPANAAILRAHADAFARP